MTDTCAKEKAVATNSSDFVLGPPKLIQLQSRPAVMPSTATEGEGLWSRGLRRGTLSPVAKPQRRGGKKRREREETQPPPPAGKREVPTSGSSDSAGAESSVTAAKPPHG